MKESPVPKDLASEKPPPELAPLEMGSEESVNRKPRAREQAFKAGVPESDERGIGSGCFSTDRIDERLGGWKGAKHLERVCSKLVETEAVLIDEEDLLDNALARVIARMSQEESARNDEGTHGAKFLAEIIPEEQLVEVACSSLEFVLNRDRARVQRGEVWARERSLRDRFLVEGMGFFADTAGLVAAHFNDLRPALRRALILILIRHVPVQEVLRREKEGEWASAEALYSEIYATLVELRSLGGAQS